MTRGFIVSAGIALLVLSAVRTANAVAGHPAATVKQSTPHAKSSLSTRCTREAVAARSAAARNATRRACNALVRRRSAARRSRKPRNSLGRNVFGVATGGTIQNENAATLARDLDSIRATRTRWVRVDVNWAQIQGRGPSSYDWRRVDRVIRGATARGIKVVGTILYTPSWARPPGTAATYGPDPAAYAAFAARAARRYRAMQVHTYEIWNEANVASFWTPAPDPAAYTRLLKSAYRAIKAADPRATVLTAGTAPAPSDGTQIAPVDFLKGIYANGGAGSFNGVAHHPYCWPANPGDAQEWSAWYQMYGTSPSLRSVMTDNGDGAKKIWATEFGAPTNGPGGVSETAQAAMVTKAYRLYRRYRWGGALFFYRGRDPSATDTSNPDNFFGLTRHDFSRKPAYTAYRRAAGS